MNFPDAVSLVNGVPQSSVSLVDRGLAYGDGVFETLAVIEGRALDLDAHLDRLERGLIRLGISCQPVSQLRGEIARIVPGWDRAVLKIIVTRGAGKRGYAPSPDAEPTRILTIAAWPVPTHDYALAGVAATVCRMRIARQPALAGIKHLNRLEHVLARSEWQDEYQEGLLLDTDGLVVEGVSSNVFVWIEGQLITPDLSQCGTEGIMRGRILAAAGELGIPHAVRALELAEVHAADALFFSNSLIGVWPVRRLGARAYTLAPVVKRLTEHLKLDGLYGRGTVSK